MSLPENYEAYKSTHFQDLGSGLGTVGGHALGAHYGAPICGPACAVVGGYVAKPPIRALGGTTGSTLDKSSAIGCMDFAKINNQALKNGWTPDQAFDLAIDSMPWRE